MKSPFFLIVGLLSLISWTNGVSAQTPEDAQIELSLRELTESGERFVEIFAKNPTDKPVEIVSEGIRPEWSVWAWFKWTVDGKDAQYVENVAMIPQAKESWRIPPGGTIYWGKVPIRSLEYKTESGSRSVIADQGAHTVTITANSRWKELRVKPAKLETGDESLARRHASEEDAIGEVALRQMFKDDNSSDKNKVYYLSVGGKEPSDALMQRFAGNDPPVAKAGDYDKQKFWFSVNKIEWVDEDTVKVGCRRVLGSPARGDGVFVFRVVRKDGKWAFAKKESAEVS